MNYQKDFKRIQHHEMIPGQESYIRIGRWFFFFIGREQDDYADILYDAQDREAFEDWIMEIANKKRPNHGMSASDVNHNVLPNICAEFESIDDYSIEHWVSQIKMRTL